MTQPRNEFTDLQLKWLAALEGGGYQQNTGGNLCVDGSFCCLGVATHIVDPEHRSLKDNGWDKEEWLVEPPTAFDYYVRLKEMVDGAVAAPDIALSLNLLDTEGSFRARSKWDGFTALTTANDSGKSFSEIATFIRSKPWLVFTNFDFPNTAVQS